jgi:hypothetical protein
MSESHARSPALTHDIATNDDRSAPPASAGGSDASIGVDGGHAGDVNTGGGAVRVLAPAGCVRGGMACWRVERYGRDVLCRSRRWHW